MTPSFAPFLRDSFARARTAVVALALLLGGSTVVCAQPTVTSNDNGYTATLTKTFDVEPGGTVEVRTTGGALSVEAWDQNRIEVVETIRMRGFREADAQAYVRDETSTYEMTTSGLSVNSPNVSGYRASHSYALRVPTRYSTDLRTSGGPIRIVGIEGKADGETSGGSIEVESITGAVDIGTSGGSLIIRDVQGDVEGGTSGGSIRVERVTGIVDVKTSGGSIRIEDAGSSVEAKTAGGYIEIARVAGILEAKTAGGGIDVRDAEQDVEVKTAGGDIDLVNIGGAVDAGTAGGDIEGRGLRGYVEARTSAGDIELEDVQASFELDTSVGDVTVVLSATSLDRDASIEVSHGDIEIRLPSDVQLRVEAEVESITDRVERDDIYSDFALTRQSDDNGAVLRAAGDLNGGGARLELRSDGGSIRIEQQ